MSLSDSGNIHMVYVTILVAIFLVYAYKDLP